MPVKYKFYFIFLLAACIPVSIFSMFQQSVNLVESLVAKKMYTTSCVELRHLLEKKLSKSDGDKALKFAIDKVKFFTSLKIDWRDENENYEFDGFTYNFSSLISLIAGYLPAPKNMQFLNDILALVYKKWPDVTESILEDYRYHAKPSIKELERIIDLYFCPDGSEDTDIFMRKIGTLCRYVNHNVLGSFITTNNIKIFSQYGDSELLLSELGKKYVNYFLTQGAEFLQKRFDTDYDEIRAIILTTWKDVDEEDEYIMDNELSVANQKLAQAALDNDKQSFKQLYLEENGYAIASLALSTSLVMKQNDGIVYLKEIYNTLIQQGYGDASGALKSYVTNPPRDELPDDFHSIQSPGFHSDGEYKPFQIPKYLKQAFKD